jgi:hypothetical protein
MPAVMPGSTPTETPSATPPIMTRKASRVNRWTKASVRSSPWAQVVELEQGTEQKVEPDGGGDREQTATVRRLR